MESLLKTGNIEQGWKVNKFNFLSSVGLAVLVLAPPMAARAADSNSIGDVVVTATKTGTTNLQKTPLSISVIGGTDLKNTQVVKIRDLASDVPALKVINANSNVVFYIRGIGGFASNNEQDVGIYEDGVYVEKSSSILTANFNDLERVEVAKGPQGTTFGRNSVGGAINFITRQPSTTFQFQDTLNLGSYNLVDEAARISGPITDNLQASGAVSYVKHDGYLTDVVPGVASANSANRFSFHGALKYEFNNDITNLVRVDYLYTHENYGLNSANYLRSDDPRYISCSGSAASYAAAQSTCAFKGFPAPLANAEVGNYHYYAGGTAPLESEDDYGINDEFNWKINDNLSLKNLLAYKTAENDTVFGGNGTEYVTSINTTLYFQKQFSDELTLQHTYGNLKGVVGFSGWTSENRFKAPSWNFANPTPTNYNPYNPGTSSESYQDTRWDTISYAVYANETYQLTKDVGIIFGARYTVEQKKLDTYNTCFNWVGGVPAGLPGYNPAYPGSYGPSGQTLCPNTGTSNPYTAIIYPFVAGYGNTFTPNGVNITPDLVQNANAFTPKIGVQWQATSNAYLYASATRGFKSGGFSFTARNSYGAVYLPEWITTYEIGAKTDWLDKKLRVNVAVFRNDWTNLQVNSTITIPGTNTPLTEASNAANARNTGLDADVTFKPWDGWTFTSSVTWIPDAVYTNYTNGQSNGFFTGLFIQRQDPRYNYANGSYNATGNRLINNPDLVATLSGQKDFDLGNGNTAFIHVDGEYTGNTYFDISNDPISRRNPFALFNAAAGWASPGGHYQVELWARNLTDKQYANTLLPGSKVPQVVAGDPRTFGIQLNYTY